MDGPCCLGIVRDSSALVGKHVSITKSLQGYYATPKTKSGKRMGIVVVHDIFGFAIPNCKYIVDYLASKGFDAMMPDFFTGKADPPAWPEGEPLSDRSFQEWFGSITSDTFWEKFRLEVDDATAFLRKKGCIRFGIVGFCWGGRAAEIAAMSGRFASTVSVHGCMHSAETYKDVQGMIQYITVPGDPYFDQASIDGILASGGKVEVFEGMHHGFVVRGDFSDKKVNAAADKAMNLAVSILDKACLRKASYVKVGTLHPDARGVNLLVKVLDEPREVQGGGTSKFFEVTCGDVSGKVILSLKDFQLEGIEKGKVITIRNASVRMVKGFMRLTVDKWGKLDFEATGSVEEVGSSNLSQIEYELVSH